MQHIIVLNPKGGSGKTTIATNLAAGLARSGHSPALMDMDPQGSSTRWLEKRAENFPEVHGIADVNFSASVTQSWLLRVPTHCDTLIVDTPAALHARKMPGVTRDADAVLVPVMPSETDIRTAARCIEDLLLVAGIRRSDNRIGIVANRVRRNTRISAALKRFLDSLGIPVVATLRDTQNYVRSGQTGSGIHDMPRWLARQDVESWESLLRWLEAKR